MEFAGNPLNQLHKKFGFFIFSSPSHGAFAVVGVFALLIKAKKFLAKGVFPAIVRAFVAPCSLLEGGLDRKRRCGGIGSSSGIRSLNPKGV
jgi:hypothetical protein